MVTKAMEDSFPQPKVEIETPGTGQSNQVEQSGVGLSPALTASRTRPNGQEKKYAPRKVQIKQNQR